MQPDQPKLRTLCQERFRMGIRKHFFSERGTAAQGGGGVTIPGGVQEIFRCCTEGHGLVRNINDTWMVGLDGVRGFFQACRFYDSVSLWYGQTALLYRWTQWSIPTPTILYFFEIYTPVTLYSSKSRNVNSAVI